MNARFYAPAADRAGELVALPEEEAAHLTRVLRLRVGADVRVFNGRGQEFDARVESIGKSGVSVLVRAVCDPGAREATVAVTLAQAVLKGDKMDAVVRDAVMMGVAAIQPIVTARTEVALASLRRGDRQGRWHRIAVSSAKQCGRAVVPAIGAPQTFEEMLAALTAVKLPGPALMLVEPSAAHRAVALRELHGPPPRETTVVVGPEGGWLEDEVERASGVCRLVSLGSRTLRADAMPLVALAALLTVWQDL